VGFLDPWVLAGAAILLAASALSVATRRRAPAVTLGVLLLILPLLPVLDVRLVGVSAQADRYLFIPSLGASLLVVEAAGALLARLGRPARRRAAIAALGVALSLSIAGSLRAASMWRDEETLCRAAIALEPRTVNMRLVLSGHYERTGREDEAWRLAAEAREIDPGDPGVSAVTMTLEARNTAASPQEEIALLRRALEVHPAHPYVWGNLSAAFLKARLHAEARDAANRSLALEPANAQVLVNLASALGGLGDHVGQEREARRALSIDPRFPLAWLNVGEAGLARGDFEAYATAVERAAALDPRLVRARLGLSMVAWRRGRTLDALREANLARELAPRDPEVWTWLGVLRRDAGDDEGARRAWEQALALDPRSAAARRYLGLPEGATTPAPR
jgi:Flp pilus assembly protein TadD